MTMTRRRLLDDTFKKSVVGNPAIATDSLARMYPGIEMQGWTEQDGTPTPEAPVPIVSAGTQNQETGKWEYEIAITNAQTDPDKNQTVTLTADRPLTKWDRLEKRNGQWGWVYKSAEIESYTDESVPGEYYSTTGQLSVGAQVWHETTTETFAPLSESEQEAMNALHTYRPTTVLSNQQGCQMTLTYKTREGVDGGSKLLKPNGAISAFNFNVKWNEINKIILRESGINDFANNMFFAGINRQYPYISIGSSGSFNVKDIEEFSCNLEVGDIADGNYHEIIFTFKKPNSDIEITNIWDESWSKEIVYHNIQFWDGDTLVRDYIPYSKNADYMYDRIGKTFVQATIPGVYQLI